MTFFAEPQFLWLLAIPVCLAFWEWFRKGQTIVMPVDHQRHKQSKGLLLVFFIQNANMLPAILMACAILLLARPMTQAPPEVVQKAKNIQIVLDLSGSMNLPFGPQSANTNEPVLRIDAAMDAIETFIDHRADDSFGLTVYGKAFIHWVPLTPDTSAIKYSRPFMTGFLGSTRTLTALAGACDHLVTRSGGERMIILLTDGKYNSEPDPERQVEDLLNRFEAHNIVLYGIFISEEEVPELEQILCTQSGGGMFNVQDEMNPDALNDLFALIDQLAEVNMEMKKNAAADNFKPFILPTLSILGLHLLTLLGLRYTPW